MQMPRHEVRITIECVRLAIRAEIPTHPAIHEAAFGRPDQADLVEALYTENIVLASLVAEHDSRLVGRLLPGGSARKA